MGTLGKAAGSFGATVLGYAIARSRALERILSPYLVASQAVPIVAIAPLLWRLDHYGIDLPKTAAPIMKYAERIFSRPASIEALTPSEKVRRR